MVKEGSCYSQFKIIISSSASPHHPPLNVVANEHMPYSIHSNMAIMSEADVITRINEMKAMLDNNSNTNGQYQDVLSFHAEHSNQTRRLYKVICNCGEEVGASKCLDRHDTVCSAFNTHVLGHR